MTTEPEQLVLPGFVFRDLDADEEEKFRQWARDNFDPNVSPSPLWHPTVRDEWQKLQKSSPG